MEAQSLFFMTMCFITYLSAIFSQPPSISVGVGEA